MAHYQQLKWIERATNFFKLNSLDEITILEIGSYNVNGSVREFFPDRGYVGVDLTGGPGVDIVCDGHLVDCGTERFDVAISCECFEHNPFWRETFENMYRMTKEGGLIFITCASRGRIEHGTTRTSPESSPGTQSIEWNYYKNLTDKDFQSIPLSILFKFHYFSYNAVSRDLYFVGQKTGDTSVTTVSWDEQLFAECTKDAFAKPPETMNRRRAFRKSIFWLLDLPIAVLSHILSDQKFQNFAVPYHSMRIRMFGLVKRIAKL